LIPGTRIQFNMLRNLNFFY